MWEIIKAGGWVMWPLIGCSVAAMGIVGERLWTLRRERVLPPALLSQVWGMYRQKQLTGANLRQLKAGSPLGMILAAGLANYRHGRDIMKESLEDAGRQVAHELERYLGMLGTIALVSPLTGLLGTVFGMIHVFSAISHGNSANPTVLASGIAEALITTAAGLAVAIPATLFHRYLVGRVEDLIIDMEDEALKLVEMIHGEREDGEEHP
ncbi:MotA/TolQ/ExbB proton channel family protein [Methylogaea oryzae]|uniref:MotA/TolQ/ExbB proton channel family protein n=1 Tax=Methylogaea oryzae TaxID=1295382 RepID=UPI000ADB1C06|nr:MotA/TolQ/ExbB proton channel family protein [Methylogaea oryzae]